MPDTTEASAADAAGGGRAAARPAAEAVADWRRPVDRAWSWLLAGARRPAHRPHAAARQQLPDPPGHRPADPRPRGRSRGATRTRSPPSASRGPCRAGAPASSTPARDGTFGLVGIRVVVAAVLRRRWPCWSWRLTRPPVRLVGRLARHRAGDRHRRRPLGRAAAALRPAVPVAVLFAVEDRLDPRWLVPIMWLWVNIHGSFPIGLAAIVRARRRPLARPGAPRPSSCGCSAGPRSARCSAASEPARLAAPGVSRRSCSQRREAFAQIAEWQPPSWAVAGRAVLRRPARPGRGADPVARPPLAQHRAGRGVRRRCRSRAPATSSRPAWS